MSQNNIHVCPVEAAGGLDNKLRRWVQNPKNILNPFIKEGMSVLDLGCGPGYFSIEMAKMVTLSGKVIAADLQRGMLDKVKTKIENNELRKIIRLHQCEKDQIGLQEQVDFVFAFYMIHEVPNQTKLFDEIKSILKPNGYFLICEPKFHVNKHNFSDMINKLHVSGFNIIQSPKVSFSRTVLMQLN